MIFLCMNLLGKIFWCTHVNAVRKSFSRQTRKHTVLISTASSSVLCRIDCYKFSGNSLQWSGIFSFRASIAHHWVLAALDQALGRDCPRSCVSASHVASGNQARKQLKWKKVFRDGVSALFQWASSSLEQASPGDQSLPTPLSDAHTCISYGVVSSCGQEKGT